MRLNMFQMLAHTERVMDRNRAAKPKERKKRDRAN